MNDKLVRGDIIENLYASENNPYRYLVFLEHQTFRSNKVIVCVGFDMKKVRLSKDCLNIKKVGHMSEFDAFATELKKLADRFTQK